MRLGDLIDVLTEAEGTCIDRTLTVGDVVHEAQRVRPGDLFVAIRGTRTDGHGYAAMAAARGAVAVVAEEPLPAVPVPVVVVPDSRKAFARLAAARAGFPARALAITAVTGTNGKTTTTYLLEHILWQAGRRVGRIGTVGVRIAGRERASHMTTPDADELALVFGEMVRAGVEECVMEASSHALAMHRLEGTEVDVAVFTNLTRDHLDFHGDMESYYRAKRRLFDLLQASRKPRRVAVLNRDDPFGVRLEQEVRGERLTYGFTGGADVSADWQPTAEGMRLTLRTPSGALTLALPLFGRHNAANAVAAAAAALARGVPLCQVAEALATAPAVPGRLEEVPSGLPFRVYVDFAHNPDGLQALCAALRQRHAEGRILLVFGCKGRDGDAEKRRQMGQIAWRGADFVFLTSDDPYDEDPEAIAAAVLAGMGEGSRVALHLDRREAIRAALGAAEAGDVVVVAGRGHEKVQVGPDGPRPFDDRAVVAEELARLVGSVLVPAR